MLYPWVNEDETNQNKINIFLRFCEKMNAIEFSKRLMRCTWSVILEHHQMGNVCGGCMVCIVFIVTFTCIIELMKRVGKKR